MIKNLRKYLSKPSINIKFYKNSVFNILPEKSGHWILRWKDKYNTPRCEYSPYITIDWLWFTVDITKGDDNQWEQWLWIHNYHDSNLEIAKKEWEWVDMDTKKSTWKYYKWMRYI